MIPLFKSQYSIGRSILTLENILNIAEINSLSEVVCVEDSFYGFRAFNQAFLEKGIKLVFGLRLSVVSDRSSAEESPSKLIFFAKNNDGLNKIKKLYTECHTSSLGALSMKHVSKEDFKDVKIAVPFYDSFIHKNLFHFGMSDLNLNELDHVFFLEDNNHPFDFQIRRVIEGLDVKKQETKSIFYKNKEDFHAFQMYKAVCGRRQGKPPVFSDPRLDHFCSDEFCWESYKDATV